MMRWASLKDRHAVADRKCVPSLLPSPPMQPVELGQGVYRTGEGVEEVEDEPTAYVVYAVKGWSVTLRSSLIAPYHGADDMHFRATTAEGVEAAMETDGLTFDVVRAVPLSDARKRLALLKRAHRAVGVERAEMTDRLSAPEDWARFAERYVMLVQAGTRHPVEELRLKYGVSRNTISARVRRARERGFLDGDPGKPANRLGPEAEKHLPIMEK